MGLGRECTEEALLKPASDEIGDSHGEDFSPAMEEDEVGAGRFLRGRAV